MILRFVKHICTNELVTLLDTETFLQEIGHFIKYTIIHLMKYDKTSNNFNNSLKFICCIQCRNIANISVLIGLLVMCCFIKPVSINYAIYIVFMVINAILK